MVVLWNRDYAELRRGDYEVVSLGPDEPPRSASMLLIGVAAAALVVGLLLGGRTDILRSGLADGASSSVPP